MPRTVPVMMVRSRREPRLRAETTPAPTPMSSHRTAAPTAIEAVTGSRVATSSLTGVDRRKE